MSPEPGSLENMLGFVCVPRTLKGREMGERRVLSPLPFSKHTLPLTKTEQNKQEGKEKNRTKQKRKEKERKKRKNLVGNALRGLLRRQSRRFYER